MLATRTPTGARSWPSLLVEGVDSSGVLPTALALAESDVWGARYVIEVSDREQWADAIGGRYLIVEHDGTLPGILQAIFDVQAEPPVDGKPTLLVVAGGTPMRRLILQRVDDRAKAAAPSGAHPDATVKAAGHVWDEVQQAFWWDWIIGARRWPGVLVVTAGAQVTDSGAYKVDVVGGTPQALTATVRCAAGQPPAIVAINTAPDPLADPIELPGGLIDAVRMLAGDLLDAPVVPTVDQAARAAWGIDGPDDDQGDAGPDPEFVLETPADLDAETPAPVVVSDPLTKADLPGLQCDAMDRGIAWESLIAEVTEGRTIDMWDLDDDELPALREELVARLGRETP